MTLESTERVQSKGGSLLTAEGAETLVSARSRAILPGKPLPAPRILVALCSYGHKNDAFLARVLAEYRSMPYPIDLVVLSNVPKELGADVEVMVGLPSSDPWSLPFGHKRLFADRIDQYDLFIYAEDDILVTQQNIDAFLQASGTLPGEVIPGFVHAEKDETGALYFDPLLSHFHWDPASVGSSGEYTFAFFTNEHSACYLLTQSQLRSAIASGGYLVPPHQGKYDLLCTAATDPYTQCGFRKMVCVSHLEDFTVLHLPNNKHADRPYRAAAFFERQIGALLNLERDGRPREPLFNPQTKILNAKWSKDYYEPEQEAVISAIPDDVRNVLSIGCGWGATEQRLIDRGMRVVGLPIDSVIGACAEDRGVEVVYGSFESARQQLDSERFDCILLSNVLHLIPNPDEVVASFAALLTSEGRMVIATPNFANLAVYGRRLMGDVHHKDLGSYEKSGIHLTSRRLIGKWLKREGITIESIHQIVPERAQVLRRASLGMFGNLLASGLVMVGRKHAQ